MGGTRRVAMLALAAVVVSAILVGVWRLRRAQRPVPTSPPASTPAWPPRPPVRVAHVEAMPDATGRGDDDGGVGPALGDPAQARPNDPPLATVTTAPAVPLTKETDPARAPVASARPLAELRDEAGRRIRDATRGCMRDEEAAAASDQTVTFRYTLVLESALGRIEGARIVESNLVDDGLRDCILGVVRDLSWKLSDAPAARLEVQDSIHLSDLRTPG